MELPAIKAHLLGHTKKPQIGLKACWIPAFAGMTFATILLAMCSISNPEFNNSNEIMLRKMGETSYDSVGYAAIVF